MEIQEVVNKVEKPNSFELGKANKRHKIYYGEVEELRKKILDLEALGLIDLEECQINKEKLEAI